MMTSDDDRRRRAILHGIGLNPKFVSQLSDRVAQTLEGIVVEVGLEGGCSESIGKLLASVASNTTPLVDHDRTMLLAYITDGRIGTPAQLAAATEYLSTCSRFEVAEFEKAAGVGLVTPPEEIAKVVAEEMSTSVEAIKQKRYLFAFGPLLGRIRSQLPFVDAAVLKEEMDTQILSLLGPRTEQDSVRTKKPKAPKTSVTTTATDARSDLAPIMTMADIEKQYIGRHLDSAVNSPELLEEHLRITGGKVITRFPPEPNGFLHIGHAKAMAFSFSFAASKGGSTLLRLDDTNPSSEKQVYVDSIVESVSWLGHTPSAITHSSDYFPQLYALAQLLIRRGKAYVCHQTQEQVREARRHRKGQAPSPWRDADVDDNLKRFEWMRQGRYREGEATLRMRIDIRHDNPCMWDPIAYRVRFEAHPHVGDAWCIYPSYDFTHCLVDSLEHITHSLCTLEFEVRRDSYYWLLEALDIYRPQVWEYSRLNITHNIMSKRKLKRLVDEGHVQGWHDPRLLTITGLRRRGYTPSAIGDFCARVGVTRTDNTIAMALLEACIRAELDEGAARTMVVLAPLKVVLMGVEEGEVIEVPIHPKRVEMGRRSIPLTRVVYIDRSDFRMEDAPGYYGLAPGKQVHLRFAHHITCRNVIKDANGDVVELQCTVDRGSTTKLKGMLQWVSGPNPLPVEVRLYNCLFKSKDPSSLGDDWLSDLNPESLVVVENALADASMKGVSQGSRFQFERLGYFVVDADSTPTKPVFNRIVVLKESKEKRDI